MLSCFYYSAEFNAYASLEIACFWRGNSVEKQYFAGGIIVNQCPKESPENGNATLVSVASACG